MTEPSQALAGLALLLALVLVGRAGMGRKLAARPATRWRLRYPPGA
jgi:hypothetical protein